MKRSFVFLLFFASIFVPTVTADDNFVLEQARRRAARRVEEKARGPSEDHPYTPIVLSLTPGLSYPPGVYDTSVAAGAIGSLAASVAGAQASGVFSLALGDVRGAQGSGVFNIAGDDVFGAQLAGVFNIADGRVSLAQAAGVFNIAEEVSGIQGAGVFNIVEKTAGVQAAGLFNVADSAEGVQAAGLFNIAQSVRGIMAAGLFNAADSVDGVMLGVVNVVDELHGAAFGIVNIIGNGVHDVSIDYQPSSGTVYFGYRTGTRTLYASFFGGLPSEDVFRSADEATLGAGVGHRSRLGPFAWDIEACAESSFDPETADRFGGLFTGRAHGVIDAFESLPVFASIRSTAGLGKMGGFGAYAGIKADFQAVSVDRIPDRLRVGSAGTGKMMGIRYEYWPKFFFGLRF